MSGGAEPGNRTFEPIVSQFANGGARAWNDFVSGFKERTERELVKKSEITGLKSEVNAAVAAVNGLKPEMNALAATFNVANAEATLVKAEWTKWDLVQIAQDAASRRRGEMPDQLKLQAQAALDLAKELRPHVQRFIDKYPPGKIERQFSGHNSRIGAVEQYVRRVQGRSANSVARAVQATPSSAGDPQQTARHLNNLERRINGLISALG
ncbi:hypothetical protein [Streptomyces sp. NPDC051561]|uniref:hypothetical protein n=1 Tax=Streptomyces sp. NPDC051561 TaxID=3365658 RepID=UPI0037984EF4